MDKLILENNNTDRARILDYIQEIDYLAENIDQHTMEQQERKAFVARCRKARVSVGKLEQYEKEVLAATETIRNDIRRLESDLNAHYVGRYHGRNRPVNEKTRKRWQSELGDKRREMELIINRIRERYFPGTGEK